VDSAYSGSRFVKTNVSPVSVIILDSGTQDSDSNGLFDTMTVNASINASVAGAYRIRGILYSDTGYTIATITLMQNLTGGNNAIDLVFDGTDLFYSGFDGPYTVGVSIAPVGNFSVFFDNNLHQTAAYLHTQFEGAQASFNGKFTDTARDTDGDGKFDILLFEVGLDVIRDGTYEIIAYLSDADANYAGYASVVSTLAAGERTVTFEFDATYLFSGASEAWWTLDSLVLFAANNYTLIDILDNGYTTLVYDAGDFRSNGVRFTGDNSDFGTDVTGSGTYDYLDVQLGVTVEVAGCYTISARLVDEWGNEIAIITQEVELDTIDSFVTLRFEGREIWYARVDGLLRVTGVSLRNDQSDLAVSGSYTTGEYFSDDFWIGAVSMTVTTLDDVVDADDGVTSLREAILYARDGDVIMFDPSLYGQTITLGGSELLIDRSITIDAMNANITIDADQKSRVLNIASGATVALAGLTITGGNIPGRTHGAGILNTGSLMLDNCTISGNSSTGYGSYGGGIYNDQGTLIVTNSTISGNSMTGGGQNYGGGIYNNRGTLTVTNCIISENSTSGHNLGGGIYSEEGTLTVANCVISGNSGDGIYTGYLGTVRPTATVTNSTISENVGRWGIYNSGVMIVTNCTISKNMNSAGVYPGGGGIYAGGEFMTVTNCIISENYSSRDGGGILHYGGELIVTNSTVSGNSAFDSGGGIYSSSYYKLTITDSIISNNSTSIELGNGGGIYFYGNNFYGDNIESSISNCNISGNSTIGSGGGIYNAGRDNAVLTVTNCTISENSADGTQLGRHIGGGGGIASRSGELNVTNCTISGNSAVGGGGGIHKYADYVLTVMNCTITGNSAGVNGSGIYSYVSPLESSSRGSKLTVANSTISGNSTVGDGGGIYYYLYNYGTCGEVMTVTNCIISENSAGGSGGAIYYYLYYYDSGGGEVMTITNCVISENSAIRYGGAIYNPRLALMTMTSCTISRNSASYGGGIYNLGMMELYNTIIAQNTTQYSNADIYNGPYGGGVPNGAISGYNSLSSFYGWTAGNRNLFYDPYLPLFLDADNGDYWLAPFSQAIDKGNNDYVPEGLTTDLSGLPRIDNSTVDIGAYEFQSEIMEFIIPYLYALLPPAYFHSTGTTPGSVSLAWIPVLDATAYELQYREYGRRAWTTVVPTGGTATIIGLDAETEYEFRICATNADGESGWATLNVTTDPLTDEDPPLAPTITEITTTHNSATLTWTASAGATAYVLQYKKASETDADWKIVTPAPTGSPTMISNLDADTLYNFRMQASNDAGSSSWATQDATTDPPVTTPITSAPVIIGTGGGGTLIVSIEDAGSIGVASYIVKYISTTVSVTQPTAIQWAGTDFGTAVTVTILEMASKEIAGRLTEGDYWIAVIPIPDTGYVLGDHDWVNGDDPVTVRKVETVDAAWLRDAIAGAKSGDTIMLDTRYSYNDTIILSGTQLYIDKSITIDAGGMNITINADEKSRVFSIASGVTVALVGLTITGGNTNNSGGGILNAGTLFLDDCTITENTAHRGGGISNSGTIEMIDTTISKNVSTSYGGGIYNWRGTTTITNSIIAENTTQYRIISPTVVAGGFGGGIYNGGTLTIIGTDIIGNKSPLFGGGGLYNEGFAILDECTIKDNEAEWGGGVTNSNHGKLTITRSEITENTAKKRGGGLANGGEVTLDEYTFESIVGNNRPDDFYGEDPIIGDEITPHASSLSIAENTPTYEISGPAMEDLFEKTMTYWEFSAVSSTAIMDWEISWGDGSETTKILGGPRSRISVTHYFQEAGTYTITVKTTDFDGIAVTAVIGIYTVKERVEKPIAAEYIALIEPVTENVEFSSQVESAVIPFASQLQIESATKPFTAWSLPVNESRFTITEDYLTTLTETMRQRPMLDLDGRNPGQTDNTTFTDLIWSDGDLFGDEWMDFSEQSVETDFWSEVFEEDNLLVSLK